MSLIKEEEERVDDVSIMERRGERQRGERDTIIPILKLHHHSDKD